MQIEICSKGYFDSIKQFKLLQDIGIGSFGTVKLAIHRGTRKQYAIKIIDLNSKITHNQLQLINRQIKIHSKLDHPHIIKLWDILYDDKKIYMIMDYAKNGNLFHYQSRIIKDGITPTIQQTYQFFYQTLQAIKYLHSNDIMHRDIKPQNLLLDQNNNIKLCDFGWATNQINLKRQTFCGTYQYMSPQMVLQNNYDYRIDIWALGILLFQLIHGKAPFQANDLKTMKQRINHGTYQLNNLCSDQLKYLIIDILQFLPQKRLNIRQIQEHEWVKSCQNLNFNGEIYTKQIINIFKDKEKGKDKEKYFKHNKKQLQKQKQRQKQRQQQKDILSKTVRRHKHQKTMGNLFNDYNNDNINKKTETRRFVDQDSDSNQYQSQNKIKMYLDQGRDEIDHFNNTHNLNTHSNHHNTYTQDNFYKKHKRNITQPINTFQQPQQNDINRKRSARSPQNEMYPTALTPDTQVKLKNIKSATSKFSKKNQIFELKEMLKQLELPSPNNYRNNGKKQLNINTLQRKISIQNKNKINSPKNYNSLQSQSKQTQQFLNYDKKMKNHINNQQAFKKTNKAHKDQTKFGILNKFVSQQQLKITNQ